MEAVSERPRRATGLLGYVLVAAAATSWGAQSVVAKLLLTSGSGLPPAPLVSTRTALATLLVLAAVGWLRPGLLVVTGRDLGRIAVLGVGMAASQYTYYFALARLPVATVLLVIYTAPLLVLAASLTLYGERPRRHDVAAATLALAGAAFVIRAYEPAALVVNAAGLAASAFCSVTFAFYNLWAKTVPPVVAPWTVLTYSLATAAVLWLPVAPPWALLLTPHPPAFWLGLGVVVLFGTLVPFSLYLAGLARISAAHASVTSTLEPAVAAAVAFAVLGESLAWPQLAGGALVLAGIGLLHLRA